MVTHNNVRLGIDLGGTKISAIALSENGNALKKIKRDSPQGNYQETVLELADIVRDFEKDLDTTTSVGIAMPGSISPGTGLVQNANSVWLNGQPLHKDLEDELSRSIRFANDANCFALSEATDGAGQDASIVFGVIIGTGCGAGIVTNRQLLNGPRAISGEWGHNPLPWLKEDEFPGPKCWCGQNGCMETWVSGPALSYDHHKITGQKLTAIEIEQNANNGDKIAKSTLDRYVSRLARGLAHVINIIDPDIIVLGGGLSKMSFLYDTLPSMVSPYIFCDHSDIKILPPIHGDDSGVRGAAWLWNE